MVMKYNANCGAVKIIKLSCGRIALVNTLIYYTVGPVLRQLNGLKNVVSEDWWSLNTGELQ